MTPFTTHTGYVSYLPMKNIDTDMVIPKQFLKTLTRTGLGKGLFYDLRYDENDQKRVDFILNQRENTSILITDENFGCGSSREHAVWALMDFGIRCVIAPGFADIFYNNCFKNGLLPVTVKPVQIKQLGAKEKLTIDLEKQEIVDSQGLHLSFEIEPFRKNCLLDGLDEISLTLENQVKIDAFEQKQRQKLPWQWTGE